MNNNMRSVASLRSAVMAESGIYGLWAKAYADVHADITAGFSTREISSALAKEGMKANKDMVTCYELAHLLTTHGDAYSTAIGARLKAGEQLRAHDLINRARMARGIGYIRASLSALSADFADKDELDKAMTKVVRELYAAKKEKKEDKNKGGQTDESTEDTTEPTAPKSPATSDELLTAMSPLVVALRKAMESGDMPEKARLESVLMEIGRIAGIHKEWVASAA